MNRAFSPASAGRRFSGALPQAGMTSRLWRTGSAEIFDYLSFRKPHFRNEGKTITISLASAMYRDSRVRWISDEPWTGRGIPREEFHEKLVAHPVRDRLAAGLAFVEPPVDTNTA